MINPRSLPHHINRKIGQAMHDYAMLADQDHVFAAVSGGIDSLVMAVTLSLWRKKAPIDFGLTAVVVDHGDWQDVAGGENPEETICPQLQRFGIPCRVVPAWDALRGSRSCFQCARDRRSQLFSLARDAGVNKLALGHHKDDLIETLFINLLYGGNISTMLPRQELFGGNLHLIRPLAFLEKTEVLELGELYGVRPVGNLCPFAREGKRERVRKLLGDIYAEEPAVKNSLFAALGNVRSEYLL
ncbi:MAG: tRNA 2-thiocytidine(32) synthetase TtcA [Deltaproteobacteria bacterium]|nr:MAG: tRNA 2-thiocytidine(32) synthetase TtcA [Deltaproteobacteria bacterium]